MGKHHSKDETKSKRDYIITNDKRINNKLREGKMPDTLLWEMMHPKKHNAK
jgi:hypothetical protein